MKKLMLSFLALSSMAAYAQVRIPIQTEKNFQLTNKVSYPKGEVNSHAVQGRSTNSEWYEFQSAYGTNIDGSTMDRSFFWLAPDTNGFSTSSTGTKTRSYIHYIGSCFDPKDSTYDNASTILTKFQKYTVDTIAFWQTYQRPLDSVKIGSKKVLVVDTVYVQYFVSPNVQFNTYSSASEPAPKHIGMPLTASYVPATRMNKSATKMDTIFLTSAWKDSTDGTSFFFRQVRIPVKGITSGSTSTGTTTAAVGSNVTAFGFTFKPMVKPALNDTFSLNGVKGGIFNKRNRYGTFINLPKNTKYEAFTIFRHSNTFLTNSELATGATTSNGWKAYYPGDFFGTKGILLDYSIFISTNNLHATSVGQVKNVTVYPNPTAYGSAAVVNFTLEKVSNVMVSVTNVTGSTVKTFNMESRQPGKQSYQIETNGLTKGIYFVNVIAGNDKVVTKLCIQ